MPYETLEERKVHQEEGQLSVCPRMKRKSSPSITGRREETYNQKGISFACLGFPISCSAISNYDVHGEKKQKYKVPGNHEAEAGRMIGLAALMGRAGWQ